MALDPPHLSDEVTAFLDASKPLVKWLDTNVGPTELEVERRG